MEHVLACIDTSVWATPVCDLAAWAARKLDLEVELLHVVQRTSAVTARQDLSGAIGPGVKGDLLEELTRLDETDARLQVERGRALLAAAEQRLKAAGVGVDVLHRHGGIVETILEREADARLVVMGKRGVSHAFAADHLGSKVERVVRASGKPILIASRRVESPRNAVLAFDGSPAARRALEYCTRSALLADLPVHVVLAGVDDARHRDLLAKAVKEFDAGRTLKTTLREGRPEEVIRDVVATTPAGILVMGAYGHSPLRNLIVGSTTTAMMRLADAPTLLVR